MQARMRSPCAFYMGNFDALETCKPPPTPASSSRCRLRCIELSLEAMESHAPMPRLALPWGNCVAHGSPHARRPAARALLGMQVDGDRMHRQDSTVARNRGCGRYARILTHFHAEYAIRHDTLHTLTDARQCMYTFHYLQHAQVLHTGCVRRHLASVPRG